MIPLTVAEYKAMVSLWKLGNATARQILDGHEAPAPHYNTLRSTLDNLREKGYLKVDPVGNTNVYTPLVENKKYKKQFLSEFVKDHFENSYKDLVAFFASQNKIKPADLEEILDIIRNKKTK
jgi:BlaI family transcriptional regulator, penicillinase repressor